MEAQELAAISVAAVLLMEVEVGLAVEPVALVGVARGLSLALALMALHILVVGAEVEKLPAVMARMVL
jgi:hypothetical protein